MTQRWQIQKRGDETIYPDLSTEEIRDGIFDGSLSGEDRAAPVGDDNWQQLATLDDFSAVLTGGQRRRRVQSADDDEFDMTPMIDVTFLLLIFFMITASFSLQKGLDFPPEKTSQDSDTKLPGPGDFVDRIILEVNEQDQFFLKSSDPSGEKSEIPAEDLVKQFEQLSQQRGTAKILVLAHEMSSHEAVVTVIDAAAQAKITDVALADIVSKSVPGSSGTLRRRRP